MSIEIDKIRSRKLLRNDILLVVVVLLIAMLIGILVFVFSKEGDYVIISIDGKVVEEVPLNQNQTYTYKSNSGYNIVQVQDSKVSVIESDCSEQVCVNNKEISKGGQTIVCLPHKFIVEIKSITNEKGYDN